MLETAYAILFLQLMLSVPLLFFRSNKDWAAVTKKNGGTQKSSLPKHCGLVSSKPVLSHPIFGSSCFLSSLVTIHVEPRYVVQLKRPTLTGDATKVQALNLL